MKDNRTCPFRIGQRVLVTKSKKIGRVVSQVPPRFPGLCWHIGVEFNEADSFSQREFFHSALEEIKG